MRNVATLAVFFLVISITWGLGPSIAKAGTDRMTNGQEKMDAPKEPEIKPDPMRSTCAYIWDRYYEREKVEINVSTRGRYDETVIFTCPLCSLRGHLVDPFLNTEYQGKTGMDRLRECGFTQAVFKGGRGIQEIVIQVPKVKPDPMRSACANNWNAYYESEKKGMSVSTRGEYDETIVFTCPNCNSNQFVNLFLNTEHEGKTGMDRIKECGFIQAVFKGDVGEEIVVEAP